MNNSDTGTLRVPVAICSGSDSFSPSSIFRGARWAVGAVPVVPAPRWFLGTPSAQMLPWVLLECPRAGVFPVGAPCRSAGEAGPVAAAGMRKHGRSELSSFVVPLGEFFKLV